MGSWRRGAICVAATGALAGCVSIQPQRVGAARTNDTECLVMGLVAGYVAGSQPPVFLDHRTRDVHAVMRAWAPGLDLPPAETNSPDASSQEKIELAGGRFLGRATPQTIDCDWSRRGAGVDAGWRPGRPTLSLSRPVFSSDGRFAAMDAAVSLPGRRVDYYRVVLSGPPTTSWDIHRIEFEPTR